MGKKKSTGQKVFNVLKGIGTTGMSTGMEAVANRINPNPSIDQKKAQGLLTGNFAQIADAKKEDKAIAAQTDVNEATAEAAGVAEAQRVQVADEEDQQKGNIRKRMATLARIYNGSSSDGSARTRVFS